MNTPRSIYPVHAKIEHIGSASPLVDDESAGYPLARRLHRVERVAAAYRGRIDKSFEHGRLMIFESADAALLGAREMQQRCSGLPQTPGHGLALRIGIDLGALRQRAQDEDDGAREIAVTLAVIDNGIVASSAVVAELNPDLRRLAGALDNTTNEPSAYVIDWHCEIPSTAYGGEAQWSISASANGRYLILRQGLKTLELTQDYPRLTIGRAPCNDLVVSDIFASRKHCRIERQADRIVLTDWSTNGTCIVQEQGEQQLVKNGSITLEGKGQLFFGRLCNGERRGGVRFEAN